MRTAKSIIQTHAKRGTFSTPNKLYTTLAYFYLISTIYITQTNTNVHDIIPVPSKIILEREKILHYMIILPKNNTFASS